MKSLQISIIPFLKVSNPYFLYDELLKGELEIHYMGLLTRSNMICEVLKWEVCFSLCPQRLIFNIRKVKRY